MAHSTAVVGLTVGVLMELGENKCARRGTPRVIRSEG